MEEITIEHMTRNEANTCLEWARKEGWNPGLHDAEVFYKSDPNGFFAAKHLGEMVGSISVVTYPSGFNFVGLLIVLPDHRNKGVGKRLLDHMIMVSKDSNTALDAVLQMANKYEPYGFVPAYQNARYMGICVPHQVEPTNLVPISSVSLHDLAEYDSHMFPSERKKFLDLWFGQPDSFGLVSMVDDQINGYGVIRRCYSGLKVGPLFADDEMIASDILSALTSKFPGEEFYLDVPTPNRKAVDLAERFVMKEVFSTVRMYTQEAPGIEMDKVFGITTFELG
jgi:GNAT superfamily N-acetyltransferase